MGNDDRCASDKDTDESVVTGQREAGSRRADAKMVLLYE